MRPEPFAPSFRHQPDRGSAPIEVVLATPLLVLMIMLAVVAGRAASVQIEVDAAAAAAARSASLQRDATAAVIEAERTALASLSHRCKAPQISVKADMAPGGVVEVRVACTVDSAGLAAFGERTVTGTTRSPVDSWRAGGDS
jgi:porphobilinogen deaminase